MDESILQELTISDYIGLLKANKDAEKINYINELFAAKIEGLTTGMDLHLFQMNKDYLVCLCRAHEYYLKFDSENYQKYIRKAEDILKQINKKVESNKKTVKTPYASFLDWILGLKKYYGSDIDKSNDLLYLISATEQMFKSINTQ